MGQYLVDDVIIGPPTARAPVGEVFQSCLVGVGEFDGEGIRGRSLCVAGPCNDGRFPVNEGLGPQYSAHGYLDFEPFVGAVKARHLGDDVRNSLVFSRFSYSNEEYTYYKPLRGWAKKP